MTINSLVIIDRYDFSSLTLYLQHVTIARFSSGTSTETLTSTEYLIRRYRTWYVRVQLPKRLWAAAEGRREFVKSLETQDLSVANSRKHAHIAEYKRQIRNLEEARHDPLRKVRMRALAWRDAAEEAKGESIQFEGDPGPTDVAGILQSEALDEIKEMAATIGEEDAARLARMVKSATPPLAEHYERWLDQQTKDLTRQTVAQHRVAVREFLKWAGRDTCIGDVDRKLAGKYADYLLSIDGGLKRKTIKRHFSSLSSFWSWLEERGLSEEGSNPWLGRLRKRGKRAEEVKRRQWTDAELPKLLTGHTTPKYKATLHDLVRLALVTGARLDELCSLKKTDVEKRKDGWWICIRQGKTEAAIREVPVHESVAHVLKRRLSTADDYLFPGLLPGGPDRKRSWYVSKAFARYCEKLGFNDEGLVFHSLRKTFIEAMEAAEVPETTVKLLVGHRRNSITYGKYSEGERTNLRKAILDLKYSRPVMAAIRATALPERERKSRSAKTTHHRKQQGRN